MRIDKFQIVAFKELDSTNNYAKQLIADGVEHGTAVLAHYQTQGKGQHNNSWESEAGKNLLFSLILYPNYLEAAKQFYLSKVVSLALLALLKRELDEITIKWPNDIYVNAKKIAGILIENSVKGNTIDSSVVGIGLNLNQELFTSDAPNPISLKQLTGKNYCAEIVLNNFFEELIPLLEQLKKGELEKIDKTYLESLFRAGEWSLFKKNEQEFEARIIGIGSFGQLKLELNSGTIQEFQFKELEFIL